MSNLSTNCNEELSTKLDFCRQLLINLFQKYQVPQDGIYECPRHFDEFVQDIRNNETTSSMTQTVNKFTRFQHYFNHHYPNHVTYYIKSIYGTAYHYILELKSPIEVDESVVEQLEQEGKIQYVNSHYNSSNPKCVRSTYKVLKSVQRFLSGKLNRSVIMGIVSLVTRNKRFISGGDSSTLYSPSYHEFILFKNVFPDYVAHFRPKKSGIVVAKEKSSENPQVSELQLEFQPSMLNHYSVSSSEKTTTTSQKTLTIIPESPVVTLKRTRHDSDQIEEDELKFSNMVSFVRKTLDITGEKSVVAMLNEAVSILGYSDDHEYKKLVLLHDKIKYIFYQIRGKRITVK